MRHVLKVSDKLWEVDVEPLSTVHDFIVPLQTLKSRPLLKTVGSQFFNLYVFRQMDLADFHTLFPSANWQ